MKCRSRPSAFSRPGREQLVEVELGDELVRAQPPALLDRAQEAVGVAEAGRGNGAHARNPIEGSRGAREDPARAGQRAYCVVARRHRAVRGLGRGGVGRLRRLLGLRLGVAGAVCPSAAWRRLRDRRLDRGLVRGRGRCAGLPAASWPRAPAGASGVPPRSVAGGARRSSRAVAWASRREPPFAVPGYAPAFATAASASWPSRAARASRRGFFAVARGGLRRRGARASRRGLRPLPVSSPAPPAWPGAAAAGFLTTGLDAAGLVFARGRARSSGGHRALGGRRGGGVGRAERLGVGPALAVAPRPEGFGLGLRLRLRLARGGGLGRGRSAGLRARRRHPGRARPRAWPAAGTVVSSSSPQDAGRRHRRPCAARSAAVSISFFGSDGIRAYILPAASRTYAASASAASPQASASASEADRRRTSSPPSAARSSPRTRPLTDDREVQLELAGDRGPAHAPTRRPPRPAPRRARSRRGSWACAKRGIRRVLQRGQRACTPGDRPSPKWGTWGRHPKPEMPKDRRDAAPRSLPWSASR